MAKLAIALPGLGVISETFLQKQVNELLPLETCIISETRKKPFCGNWGCTHPQLIMDELTLTTDPGLYSKIRSKMRRLAGLDDGSAKTKTIAAFLSEQEVKVFLGEYLDFSLYYLPICKGLGIRFFAHAHGYDVSSRLKSSFWVKKYLLLNQADGIITMSEFSKLKLQDAGITAPIHVIPYGVYPFTHRKLEITANDKVVFLFSGRFVAKKAPFIVLRSFFIATKLVDNIKLIMIGAGELWESVKNECIRLNLTEMVEFTGALPNEKVLEIMSISDVYVQHSMVCPDTGDMEGLPVAILEAMASGLPIVSTIHSGIPEAITDNLNGFLVDEGDFEAMAERMVYLAQNPELRNKMRHENQKKVTEKYLWKTERSRLLQVLGLTE